MKKQKTNCHYCNAKAGQLHKESCKIETKRGKPHFYRTSFCNCCGKERPKWFMVPNKEWKRVVMYYYKDSDVLCKKCYDYVKKNKEKWKKKGVNMFKAGLNLKFLSTVEREKINKVFIAGER